MRSRAGSTAGIYLRDDAIAKVTAPLAALNLTRHQQAALLGLGYTTFWRLSTGRTKAGDRAIVDVLCSAQRIRAQYGGQPLGFDDLFEVRDGSTDATDSLAA